MKQKPKQRLKSEDRKCAMLAAARELFLAKGFAATSLEDVVAKSGGSLATLYQLFGNKEGLWRELVHSYTDRIAEPMQAEASDQDKLIQGAPIQGPPAEVLRDVAQRLLALKLHPDAMAGVRIIMTEGGKYPDLARLMYENGPLAGERSLADYLQKQVDAGVLAIDDVQLAAQLFCNLVSGEFQLWSVCGIKTELTPEDAKRRLDEVVRIFLAAYAIPRR
ncbi:MAG: TetR/AcrR family transcriptional regulator [Rhodospirillaceae bacterium]|nr:TetR/AcrR family transcriptional regulator [Rhodospirillaceae bacterium]